MEATAAPRQRLGGGGGGCSAAVLPDAGVGCLLATSGAACNGRRLTAILYLNTRWRPKDGGELLLYPPLALSRDGKSCTDTASLTRARSLGRVAPVGNRLLLFYADARVPHEVLPSYADRYAVTLWYYDREELARSSARART